MAKQARSDAKTRLLRAAGAVFTEHGFEKATVREICRKAGTNVASVNYYFQDKAGLFAAVLSDWWKEGLDLYPPEIPEDEDLSPRDKLRLYARSHILRMFYLGDIDPEARIRRGKLILREFAKDNPPPAVLHDLLMREVFALEPILREFLGKDCPQKTMWDCCVSVRSQAIMYFLIYLHDKDESLGQEQELLRIADHIAAFSLGGLTAIRETLT